MEKLRSFLRGKVAIPVVAVIAALAILLTASPALATCSVTHEISVCSAPTAQFCIRGSISYVNGGGYSFDVHSFTQPNRLTAVVFACLLYVPTSSWVGGCPYQTYVGGTSHSGYSLPNGDVNTADYQMWGLWYNTSGGLVGSIQSSPQRTYCP